MDGGFSFKCPIPYAYFLSQPARAILTMFFRKLCKSSLLFGGGGKSSIFHIYCLVTSQVKCITIIKRKSQFKSNKYSIGLYLHSIDISPTTIVYNYPVSSNVYGRQ